ncbi:hypothetical protein ONR57_12790 [Hoyosella sp. YIM 151337]|uniref:hypothetical protein n=1 Tax=Hoyosella sp. YIM 151337 TaxID=2992742 RepID=UPI00223592A1|nr:hypothetical protein [Hoyosella sp. YIM 151337]MCW4354178.1 hypothetical protein [Hoyosella sp. YIM 151337]
MTFAVHEYLPEGRILLVGDQLRRATEFNWPVIEVQTVQKIVSNPWDINKVPFGIGHLDRKPVTWTPAIMRHELSRPRAYVRSLLESHPEADSLPRLPMPDRKTLSRTFEFAVTTNRDVPSLLPEPGGNLRLHFRKPTIYVFALHKGPVVKVTVACDVHASSPASSAFGR